MSGTTGMRPDQMRPVIEGTVEVFESMLRVRLQ